MEGNQEDLQGVQILVPYCRLSLNPSVCCLYCRVTVRYSNEELSLEETIFLDTGDVLGSED